jgi:hypothetical protein
LPVLPLLAGAGETVTECGAAGLIGYLGEEHGLVVDREALVRSLPALDAAYLRGASDKWATDLVALPGLQQHEAMLRRCRAFCGSVIGPISLSLQLVDGEDIPLAGEAVLLSALAQHLFLRRQWLHKILKRSNERVLVWLYEPSADMINSPFCPAPVDALCAAVDQALGYDQLRAVWMPDVLSAHALLDAISIDILGLPLPALEQAKTFAPLLRRLLDERGGVGWGVVPTRPTDLAQTSVGRVAACFGEWLRALEGQGFAPDDVAAASFVMPEGTLAQLGTTDAERVLSLTADVASVVRQSYGME